MVGNECHYKTANYKKKHPHQVRQECVLSSYPPAGMNYALRRQAKQPDHANTELMRFSYTEGP
ncbi:hypothetical protein DZJ_09940 [Dickeya ananatis]